MGILRLAKIEEDENLVHKGFLFRKDTGQA